MADKPVVILDPRPRLIDEIFWPVDLQRMHSLVDVVWGRDDMIPTDVLLAALPQAEAIVCGGWRYGPILDQAPRLRAIMEVGGGPPRGLDYGACQRRGIRVLSCAPAFAPQVAEMALGMALAVCRQIVASHESIRAGTETWARERNPISFPLAGKPVGIVGYGGLSEALRPMLDLFKCPVSIYDPWLSDGYIRSTGATPLPLERLLAESRFIFVMAVPTAENLGLLTRQMLELIKPDAVLAVVSRAHLVDFDALTEMLYAGRFRAAIDVFPEEPLPPDHPIRQAPNVVLTAHFAGSTTEGRREIGRMLVDDLEAIVHHLPPRRMQVVEPELARATTGRKPERQRAGQDQVLQVWRSTVSDTFIGIQMGPHSVYDEGIDYVLDLVQETAHVNTILVYSQTYLGVVEGRAVSALADHGVPIRDHSKRHLTKVWVEPHDEHYAGTFLRHRRDPGKEEYADRDVLDDLREPTRRRGMKLYPRILEGSGQALAARIDNWPKVLCTDVYGRINRLPCWNNPDYRNWWLGTIEDMFCHHDLDGLQWGAERSGPLSRLLYNLEVPACFCTYCRAKGRALGINVERARQGFQDLYEFLRGIEAGGPSPADGVLINVIRVILKYPEILSWEMLWRQSLEETAQQIYGIAKLISPQAQVGRHFDHAHSSWDMIFKAEMSYADVVPYTDFIKPILYHDILGPRLRWWVLERLHRTTLREVTLEQSLELFYDVMGYDKSVEPGLDQLNSTGMTPDYVYRMTKQIVDVVKGKAAVYAGIGLDIPWGSAGWDRVQWDRFAGDPDNVYKSVRRAFDAGANGILVSREYDEMRMENLRAVGRAVGEMGLTG